MRNLNNFSSIQVRIHSLCAFSARRGAGEGGEGEERENKLKKIYTRPSFSNLLAEMIWLNFHSVKNGSGKFSY